MFRSSFAMPCHRTLALSSFPPPSAVAGGASACLFNSSYLDKSERERGARCEAAAASHGGGLKVRVLPLKTHQRQPFRRPHQACL